MIPDPPNNQRVVSRAGIERGALLFFKGQPGARGCNVIDISDCGAKLRTQIYRCCRTPSAKSQPVCSIELLRFHFSNVESFIKRS